MKTIQLTDLAWFVLCAAVLPSAMANHSTGKAALPELLVAGDFNQDGKLDLAVNVTGFDNVAILLGDGMGGLTLRGHLAVHAVPRGLAAGDINRDGHLDLVTADLWGYDLVLLLGDGLGGFNPAGEVDGDGEPTRLLLRDFNNDGRLDIVTNAKEESKIRIYLGDGAGGFISPATELPDLHNAQGMAAGDFNGDNNLDLAIPIFFARPPNGTRVSIQLGDGKGGFHAGTEFPVNNLADSVAVGHLNKDGLLDLVVAGAIPENNTGNFISTYLGDGTGRFVLKNTIDLGEGRLKGEITVGDFNEDGFLDVAFPQGLDVGNGKVLLFFGDGTGGLRAGPVLTAGLDTHTVITADFNQDGHLDLAVSNSDDATVSLFLGDGTGNFTTASITSVVSPIP